MRARVAVVGISLLALLGVVGVGAGRTQTTDGCGVNAPVAHHAGGVAGVLLADSLVATMNLTGAVMFTAVCWILGLYLVSTFEMSKLAGWLRVPAGWFSWLGGISTRWIAWREERTRLAKERAQKRALRRAMAAKASPPETAETPGAPPIVDHFAPPFVPQTTEEPEAEIPIRTLEHLPPDPLPFEPKGLVDVSPMDASPLIRKTSQRTSSRTASPRRTNAFRIRRC